jgi:hypothetical protein
MRAFKAEIANPGVPIKIIFGSSGKGSSGIAIISICPYREIP